MADSENSRIQCLDAEDGDFWREYGSGVCGDGIGQLDHPQAVTVHDTEVIVCDTYNNRLVVFDRATGAVLRTFGGTCTGSESGSMGSGPLQLPLSLNFPSDVALAPNHEFFVCDMANHRVLVFT